MRRKALAGLGLPLALAFTAGIATPAHAASTTSWQLNEPAGAKTAFSSGVTGLNGVVGAGITTGVSSGDRTVYKFTGAGKVAVADSKKNPAINPGARDFEFSVTFRKSVQAQEANLFQKRLAGTIKDPETGAKVGNGQWKVDTTYGDQYCTFRGDETTLTGDPSSPDAGGIKVRATLAKDVWYTITCKKTASAISISIKNENSGKVIATRTAAKAVGTLQPNTAPVTLGGKAGDCGTNCDYLQGEIDKASITIY